MKNDDSLAEHAKTLQNGQAHFTEPSRMITHSLSMHRHCKMVRITSHKHQEWSLTRCGCTDIANGQGHSTQAPRMITHKLSMHRHCKMVRVTSHKHQEWSLTSWGCTVIAEWSGSLHAGIKNDYSQPDDAQTLQNGQGHFTQASRMITHILRMHRHCKMVRVTLHKHQEWSLTFWGSTEIAKWSGSLHKSIKNDHSQTEHAQTLQNGQGHFTQASRMITHFLRLHRDCKMVRVTGTPHKHQEWSLTRWACTDIAEWSLTRWACTDIAEWWVSLDTSIKTDHSLAEHAQTLQNGQGHFTQPSRMINHSQTNDA